jgi:hypothetical protein
MRHPAERGLLSLGVSETSPEHPVISALSIAGMSV